MTRGMQFVRRLLPLTISATVIFVVSAHPSLAADTTFQPVIDKAVVGEVSRVDLSQFPTGTRFGSIKWWISSPLGGGPVTTNFVQNNPPPWTPQPLGKSYTPTLTVPVYCENPVPATLNVEVDTVERGGYRASMPLKCAEWPMASYETPHIRILKKTTREFVSEGEFLAGDNPNFGGTVINPPPANFIDRYRWGAQGQWSESSFLNYSIAPTVGTKFELTAKREYYGYLTPNLLWTGSITYGPKLTLTPAPEVSGSPTAGSLLTAKPGVWDSGVSLSYRWVNAAGNLEGNGPTKPLVASDVGRTLFLEVIGTKPGYIPVTVRSTPQLVGPQKIVPTPSPSPSVSKGVPTPSPSPSVSKGVPTPSPSPSASKGVPTPSPSPSVSKGVPTPVPSSSEIRKPSNLETALKDPKILSVETLSKLTPAEISKIPRDTFSQIPSKTFSAISSKQSATISAQQISSLSTTSLRLIPPSSISSIKPSTLAALTTSQLSKLTTVQKRSLTTSQLKNLPLSKRKAVGR